MTTHSVAARLRAVGVAQVSGFVLLFVSWVFLSSTQASTGNQAVFQHGLRVIMDVLAGYLVLSIMTAVVIYWFHKTLNSEKSLSWLMATFLFIDISGLLILVCQEGGLCRSAFLPIYFLIPAGYFAAEGQPKKRLRHLMNGGIASSLVVGYFISWLVYNRKVTHLIFVGNITDFHVIAEPAFDRVVLLTSLLTLFTPAVQILFRNMTKARTGKAAKVGQIAK